MPRQLSHRRAGDEAFRTGDKEGHQFTTETTDSALQVLAVSLVLGLMSMNVEAFELDSAAYLGESSTYNASDSSFDASGKPTVDATVQGTAPGTFASAHGNATAGMIGIGLATTSNSYTHADASAKLTEDWTCFSTCITTVFNPVTYRFHLSGLLSPDWFNQGQDSYYSFGGSIIIDTDTFSFLLGSSSLDAQYCDWTGCRTFTLASTTLPDGSVSFDDTVSFDAYLGLRFQTGMTMAAGWDPVIGPSSLDFLNTFGFDIVSNGDAVWNSDGGRGSISGLSSTSVPEPATLSLMAVGMAGTLIVRRRKR